jgi:hypothetical protein
MLERGGPGPHGHLIPLLKGQLWRIVTLLYCIAVCSYVQPGTLFPGFCKTLFCKEKLENTVNYRILLPAAQKSFYGKSRNVALKTVIYFLSSSLLT